jgi:hypothetical protein
VTDWRIVAAEIKAFDDRRELLKAMRRGLRQPVPEIRRAIKARALSTLPKRGGLNKWVASVRVTSPTKINNRQVSLKLKGGRNSSGGRSDISAIDRGRVRAPAWGRKGVGSWHTQAVSAGFFTQPAAEAADKVLEAIDGAVDSALNALRRG